MPGFIFFFSIIFTLQIPTINSFSPFQYKFSKLYIGKAGGTKTDLLPDKLPETLTYYNLWYFPGFLQASPLLTLDLTTDDKGIAEIQSEAEKGNGRGTIYIISSNGNWNHQHTKSITINFDTNTVTYGA